MKRAFLGTLLALAAGCQGAAPVYVNAVAPDLSTEQLAELQEVIRTALDLPNVRLGNTVFSSTHILVLEHALANTPQGRIATGRTTTRPETFHLLSDGKQCVVERLSSGQRYPVSFNCRPRDG